MSFLVSLTHLRSFLAVADAASVTAAAVALGYTQSAVSLHIKALERDLGTPLFHRDRCGMPLTEVGACLLAEARAMVANLANSECRMRAAVAGCVSRAPLPATDVGRRAPAVVPVSRRPRSAAPALPATGMAEDRW